MKIWKNIGLILASFLLSYFLNVQFHKLYLNLYHPDSGGSFYVFGGVAEYFSALNLAYLFFLFLLFTAFGDRTKYWWAGIAAIPALAFLLYFDFSHVYFHLLFPIVGWIIGWGIAKLISRSRHGTV